MACASDVGNPYHGCIVTGKWDWTVDARTGRWSNPQQCYKRQRVHIPRDADDPEEDGYSVRETKLKIRGKGKALTLRFESEEGKDFQILGWSVPYTANGAP